MFALEALAARFGDALIVHFGDDDDPKIVVIDGGPTKVFTSSLRPALEQLREDREIADDDALPIELMMVSHLDADHITGILELVEELKDSGDNGEPVPWEIERFWINTFDDLIGNADPGSVPASSSSAGVASLGGFDLGGVVTAEADAILATVAQGRNLRKLLKALGLGKNKPFGSLVMVGHPKNPVTIDGLKLTVIGPQKPQLDALQVDWDTKIKPLLKTKTGAAEVASYLDKSVYNLSSIVVLAEFEGHSMLLTGDARGDFTLEALQAQGLLDHGPLHVDILKLPHHGSDRDVKLDYFQKITADHYVISADGTNDNPDVPTLEMISQSRADDAFTVYFTNPLDKFAKPAAAEGLRKFLKKERDAGRHYKVVERKANDLSIRIDL